MTNRYTLVPIEVPVDRYPGTPPGLLLSLGDGSAVERSAEHIAAALYELDQRDHVWWPPWEDLEDAGKAPYLATTAAFIAALIQQAQEARDV